MQMLQKLFGQRLSSFLILLVLLGAILLAGPSLGLSAEHTYLVALGTALAFFGLYFGAQYRAAKSAQSLEQALRQQGLGQLGAARPGDENLEDLRKQFEESLVLLRQSRLGRGALYKLPWFVLLGPPGSGKTTLLRESGLSFPYMTKGRAAIRGLGGTKNCDWWFADRGVLLDTAGRYTSEHEDRGEWLSFLDLLKKGRKKQPINGAIVAVSLEDVVSRSETEVRKLADDVRDRIDELTRRLEVVFPVYLVFTKCDGLLGFVETFSGLSKEQRAQVWGFTFPYDRPKDFDFQAAFAAELGAMQGQLGKRRLGELAVESTRRRRQLVYRLPHEFAAVRDKLGHFVELIQQENPYQEVSAIRGCYFTSGTQERSALGDLLAEMARKSGIAADEFEVPPGERKCYFVDDVFQRIVFDDGELAMPTRAAGKRRRLLQGLQLGAAGLLALILLWAAFARFFSVADLTGRITEIVAATRRPEMPAAERYRVLGDLARLTGLAGARAGDPEVHGELELLLLGRLRSDIVQPAVRELQQQLPASATPELPDVAAAPDLFVAAASVAEARAAAQRRHEEARSLLTGSERRTRARAAFDRVLQRELPGDAAAQQRALSLFEDLLGRYSERPDVTAPFDTALQQGEAQLRAAGEALRQQERVLLDRMKADGGRWLQPVVHPAESLQPAALGCAALASTAGIASTLVDFESLQLPAPVEGREPPPPPRTLREVRLDAQQRVQQLRGMPCDETLRAERDAIVEAAGRAFEQQVLPDLVRAGWAQFLPRLELDRGLREPKQLASRFDDVLGGMRRLCSHYARATGLQGLPTADKLMTGLAAIRAQAQACAAAADLGQRIGALETLASVAKEQSDQAARRWTALLGDRAAAGEALARAEERALDRVVVAVLEDTVRQLSDHYLAVRGTHGELQRLFPFTDGADDVPLDRFFRFLDDLEALDRASTRLPSLARQWLGDAASAVPEPTGDFAVLLQRAREIYRCFDRQAKSLTVLLYVDIDTGVAGYRVLSGDKAVDEFSMARMGGDRSKANKIVLGGEQPLQLMVTTGDGEFTLSNLKLALDKGLRERITGSGLGRSFFNLFRLCFAVREGGEARTPPSNLASGYRVFPVVFERPGRVNATLVSTSVRLLIGGQGNGEEKLFTGPAAFTLSFPAEPPWRLR